VLQAGEINTGSFDDYTQACRIAHERSAWVHVDGAFELWVAVSRRHRHLLAGIDAADSWTTDAHKSVTSPEGPSSRAFRTEAVEPSLAPGQGHGDSSEPIAPLPSRYALCGLF
jgi:glutamate/tyrosine decarboxylase-like PLP-dependent enzyme